MRPTALNISAVVIFLLGFGIPSLKAQKPINVVTTAVPFLRISPDARSGGMGDLSVATSPDASASYFNLGKVPFNESVGGINVTEAGQGWAFGAALTNLGSKIAYTDNADQKDFIPANLGLGTTYTKVIDESNKISFGVDLNKLLVPTPPNPLVATPADYDAYRKKSVIGSWFSSFGDAPDGFSEEL